MPQNAEEYIRKRIDEISTLIFEVANGNFDYKLEADSKGGELDGLIGGINMLGEELKSSTVSRDFMESIYRGVVDILIILSPDYKIERVNDALTQHLGYYPSELIGKNFETLICKEDKETLEKISILLDSSNANNVSEIKLRRKDGVFLETSS